MTKIFSENYLVSILINSIEELDPNIVHLVPMGGQGELGLAFMLLIYQGKILILDAGAAYPNYYLPSVDLIMPNTAFLEKNVSHIVGLVLTSGREEHIGAFFYLLHHLDLKHVYAPEFVVNLLHRYQLDVMKVASHDLASDVLLNLQTVKLGLSYLVEPFSVEWLRADLSNVYEFMLKIQTDQGIVFYTSTFKLGKITEPKSRLDVSIIAKVGDEGVLALLSDSAGVENSGYSLSEAIVQSSFDELFQTVQNRLIVIMSEGSVARLQGLIDLARLHKRHVVLMGDVLVRYVLTFDQNSDNESEKRFCTSLTSFEDKDDASLLIIVTGSIGCPMDGLLRFSTDSIEGLKSKSGDVVVYSADVPLGQKRYLAQISDRLLLQKITLIKAPEFNVHVNEHASQEELKLIISLTRPKCFIPVLGEYRHIYQHAKLAQSCGLTPDRTIILNNGDVLSLGIGALQVKQHVEAAPIYFSRLQGEKISTASIKERRSLCLDGVVALSLVVNLASKKLVSPLLIQEHASGMRHSIKWESVKVQINDCILRFLEEVETYSKQMEADSLTMPDLIRQEVASILKKEFHIRPYLQILVTEL